MQMSPFLGNVFLEPHRWVGLEWGQEHLLTVRSGDLAKITVELILACDLRVSDFPWSHPMALCRKGHHHRQADAQEHI